MSALNTVDTIQDLREWVAENFPNALVVDADDEVIIQLGVVATMGGYLEPIEREDD